MQNPDLEAFDELNEDLVDFVANIPLFDALDAEELTMLVPHMNVVTLSKDEILWNEWDKGDYICFVVRGTLEVLKKTGADAMTPIASLERGRSVGELSIVEHFPRSATLRARTDAVVSTLSRESFESLMVERTEIGIKILKNLTCLLAHNLRKTSSRLVDYMLPMS